MTKTNIGTTDKRSERASVGSLVRQADNALGHVWEALLTGRLGLEDVRAVSPNLFALLITAEQMGEASQEARVLQAEWTSNRLYAKAYPSDNADRVQARLDAALEAMPADILEHSPDYFRLALAGSIGGAA